MAKTPRIDLDHIGHAVKEYKIGVIDIGSNSVRLVVYDGIKRAPIPIYNEKVMCALGKGLSSSGKLNPKGVEQAKTSIARFLAITKLLDVIELHVLATAAVRDASDGAAFVEQLERAHRVSIDTISGQREARLAAMGVLASFHEPVGLVGDLGGGSLELLALSEEGMGTQSTMPIGPLRLQDESNGKLEKMEKIIDKHFAQLSWLGTKRFSHFYAIGGSFRSLAKMHMIRNDYPLNIIHGYTVLATDMQKIIKEVLETDSEDVADIPGVPGKRAANLQPAALMLRKIIQAGKVDKIVFSVSGIREGYLYDKLSPYIQEQDALIASAADMIRHDGKSLEYAKELFEWMSPLFPKEKPELQRLRLVACIVGDVASTIHTEYRAQWAFNRIIQSSLMSLSHTDRIIIATALFHRHQFKMKNNQEIIDLVDEKFRAWARTVGQAINLAFYLSAGEPDTLPDIRLMVERGVVKIEVPPAHQPLISDSVRKRIDGLGEAHSAFASFNK